MYISHPLRDTAHILTVKRHSKRKENLRTTWFTCLFKAILFYFDFTHDKLKTCFSRFHIVNLYFFNFLIPCFCNKNPIIVFFCY